MQLLTDQTANASSTKKWNNPRKSTGTAYGTWDTSTLTFEYTPDGGTTWIAIASGLTANGYQQWELPGQYEVRATLSSVGGTTSISVAIEAMHNG